MSHCIYWIRAAHHTDILSEGYIGVSKDAEKRFMQHKKRAQNRYLKHATNKYGWDNLVKSVLLIAEEDYCLSVEKKLRPQDKIGWNIVAGGGKPPLLIGPRPKRPGRTSWNKGKSPSKETRAKISAAVKLQMQDPEHRAMLSRIKLGKPSGFKGRKMPPEAVEKMRLAKIGVPSKKRGVKLSGETLKNVQEAARFSWVCPHCQKSGMGRGAANRWHFDACKSKEIT